MDIKHLVFLIGLVIGCALVTGALADQSEQPAPAGPEGIRTNVDLPPLFDFAKYKSFFDKTYRGLGEELNRARLFFARAFKVFIARVKYIHRSSNKYLAINEMSDWTPAERDSMYRLESPPGSATTEPVSREPAEIPAADLDTIKRKLAELAGRETELPEFRQIADQLGAGQQQQSHRRRKRSAGSRRSEPRSLPMDSLVHDPRKIAQEVSPKLVRYVPSSNPQHSDIELPSQGAEDDLEEHEIPESERKQIETESSKAASLDKYASGLSKEQQSDSNSESNESPVEEDKMFLDLREKNCTAPVKKQWGCGSCYIFATIELFEYHHCMKTGKLVRFAEQYPIDCGLERGLKGCNGGRPEKVTAFAREYGLELGTYYGYKAAHRSCPYDLDQEKELAGHVRVKPFSRMGLVYGRWTDAELIAELLEVRGPMVIEVLTNEEFPDYGGGVDMLENGRKDHAHAMTLLGHGIEDGREYWLIKNSHGLSWGQKGYYKLDKRADTFDMLFDYLDVGFMDNERHDPELVKQKIKKNLPLHEKMFGWTGFYDLNI